MPLPEDVIGAQQFGFSVCAGESTVDATQNDIFGEKDCYCENQSRATFYWWAVDVLARTPAEGDDDNCCAKCVTDEFACDTIRTMSPGCITCGCGNPDDVPESCDITYAYTVFNVADAALQLSLLFMIGTPILISSNVTGVSNEWSLHIGQIAISNGTSYTYIPLPVGSVVLSMDAPFVLGDFNSDFNLDFNI